MSALTDHTVLSSPTAKIPSVLAALWRLVQRVLRERELRRAIRSVQELDDALLRDIGLAPGGIEDVVRHGRACRTGCGISYLDHPRR